MEFVYGVSSRFPHDLLFFFRILAPMTLINAEEFSGNWRENYFSELFSLSRDVFFFFDNSTARKGSEPARTSAERDARSTIHKRNWDNWEAVNRLWTLGKEFPCTFFFGFNNGRCVIKRSTSKVIYSSDAARRFRPDTIRIHLPNLWCEQKPLSFKLCHRWKYHFAVLDL